MRCSRRAPSSRLPGTGCRKAAPCPFCGPGPAGHWAERVAQPGAPRAPAQQRSWFSRATCATLLQRQTDGNAATRHGQGSSCPVHTPAPPPALWAGRKGSCVAPQSRRCSPRRSPGSHAGTEPSRVPRRSHPRGVGSPESGTGNGSAPSGRVTKHRAVGPGATTLGQQHGGACGMGRRAPGSAQVSAPAGVRDERAMPPSAPCPSPGQAEKPVCLHNNTLQ